MNTASRLEGINKLYGTLICVGQNIYESEKDTFVFRKLDSIMVKGKDRSLWIYELVGYREQVEEMTLTKIARFEQGLALYQSQSFIEAQKIFESLITEYQDPPSVAFIERTKEYIKNGCPPDWNGEYRALEK